MFGIGFHQDDSLVYEGQIGFGRAVSPAPVLSVATLISKPADTAEIPESSTLATRFVFREDSFDAVTRIRRGRLYRWADSYAQPHRWRIQPHPGLPDESAFTGRSGVTIKDLYTWAAWSAFQQLAPRAGVLVALGSRDAYTLWRVNGIERIVTGEDLLTLRAHNSLGALPILNISAIPHEDQARVEQAIEKLANAAHRSSEPEAIVDLARSAAVCCLGAWLAEKRGDPAFRSRDLGALAGQFEHREKEIALLLARLHSRAKPNEQFTYRTRPIVDEDAEFALASIALLLRELGWAR